jgi:oxaloacetate decarboxylase alpha subunit
MRAKYPGISDEERLLRHLYAGSQVDDMRGAGALQTEYHFDKPVVRLMKELARRPRAGRVYIEKGDFRLTLDSTVAS